MLLEKTKWDTIKVLILIDSYISHYYTLYKYGWYRQIKVVYERDSVEIIVDKDGILCLHEKHI